MRGSTKLVGLQWMVGDLYCGQGLKPARGDVLVPRFPASILKHLQPDPKIGSQDKIIKHLNQKENRLSILDLGPEPFLGRYIFDQFQGCFNQV